MKQNVGDSLLRQLRAGLQGFTPVAIAGEGVPCGDIIEQHTAYQRKTANSHEKKKITEKKRR